MLPFPRPCVCKTSWSIPVRLCVSGWHRRNPIKSISRIRPFPRYHKFFTYVLKLLISWKKIPVIFLLLLFLAFLVSSLLRKSQTYSADTKTFSTNLIFTFHLVYLDIWYRSQCRSFDNIISNMISTWYLLDWVG